MAKHLEMEVAGEKEIWMNEVKRGQKRLGVGSEPVV